MFAEYETLRDSHKRLEASHTALERKVGQRDAVIEQQQITWNRMEERLQRLENMIAILRPAHQIDALQQIKSSNQTIIDLCDAEINQYRLSESFSAFLPQLLRRF